MQKHHLLKRIWQYFNAPFIFLIPLGDLIIRLWVARVFLLAGLSKCQSWTSTLYLFDNEYSVPFLSSTIAAPLAAGVEIIGSICLALGVFGRVPAFMLFIFNFFAVMCYPYLWTAQGYVGFKDHVAWGLMLMVIMLHGPGKLSLDYLFSWILKRFDYKF